MPGWLTPAAVVGHANVAGTPPNGVALVNVCAAAEAWIEATARKDLPWSTANYQPPADVKLGGLMLAWRWYSRRSSPLGVVQTPTGDPAEMLRNDPDIARLLGATGSRFKFGAGRKPVVEEIVP